LLLPFITGATPGTASNEALRAAALPSDATPVHTPARQPVVLTSEAAGVLSAIAHRTADASNANALFAPKSWYTPPPPATVCGATGGCADRAASAVRILAVTRRQ